ncbi:MULTISPECIES: hypothetical protein [Fusobacterium]|jgi:hypothetical protein|uniref:Conjugal transfer protein TrbL n=1 Tax=Fusobacterium animalis F0419 TaxID=999414 RepID=H1HF02_9FUSO|nr:MULTISPECIES: hypothetical protein [Fusobacterium]EHO78154.1 hypothetical protein HMPREF9942_01053 [Fusobacterium animalis F0419]ERT35043.1 hypothetical protein HMPREF1766_01518 [Fusobacterium nucleatum CTI-5]
MKKISYLIISLFFTFFLSINIYSAPPSRGRGSSTTGTTERNVSTSRLNINTLANESGFNYKPSIFGGTVYKSLSQEQLTEIMAEYQKAVKEDDQAKMEALRQQIKHNSEEGYEFLKDRFKISTFIREFMSVLKYIPLYLKDICVYLLGIFCVLEGIAMLLEKPTEFPIGKIATLLVRYGLIKFSIVYWFEMLFFIENAIKVIALKASRMAGQSISFSTDAIWDVYTQPFLDTYTDMSWWEPIKSLSYIIMMIPGYIICALITLDLFMAQLEAMLLCAFSIVLLPFMIWRMSANIGGKVLAVLSAQYSKLMIMYFFIAFSFFVVPTISPFSFFTLDNYGFILLTKYTLILFLFGKLIGRGPALASALMSGAAGIMSGKDVSNPIMSGIAKGVSLAAATVGGAIAYKTYRAEKATTSALKNTIGNMADAAKSSGNNNSSDSNRGN